MASLENLLSSFEGVSNQEVSEIIDIITHSNIYGDSELERRTDELHDLKKLHQSILEVSEKVYHADDPDYISAVDSLHRIEKQREDVSEDIMDFLEEIREYAASNEASDERDLINTEVIVKAIEDEKQARKIEGEIESDLLKAFRKKAFEQAEEIMEAERFHVKFREDVLQEFLEFAYSETFQDPVLEAAGAFKFRKIDGADGRDFDYFIEEFIPCPEYIGRGEDSVRPSKDFVEEVRERKDLDRRTVSG